MDCQEMTAKLAVNANVAGGDLSLEFAHSSPEAAYQAQDYRNILPYITIAKLKYYSALGLCPINDVSI